MSAVSGDCRRRSVMVIRLYGVTIDCRARQEMYRYLATAPKHRSSYLHFEPGGGICTLQEGPIGIMFAIHDVHFARDSGKDKGRGKDRRGWRCFQFQIFNPGS